MQNATRHNGQPDVTITQRVLDRSRRGRLAAYLLLVVVMGLAIFQIQAQQQLVDRALRVNRELIRSNADRARRASLRITSLNEEIKRLNASVLALSLQVQELGGNPNVVAQQTEPTDPDDPDCILNLIGQCRL